MTGKSDRMRVVVAITGASGAIYAVRFVKAALEHGLDVDCVVSDYGKRLLIEECELNLKTEPLVDWLDRRYGPAERTGTLTEYSVHDLGAPLASGSRKWDAMVVVPCSMKTLSGIRHGSSTNLIERAADVTLKERRPLLLVPRESPLNQIHLENLADVGRVGATVVPAMPAFYYGPTTFEDLADFIAGRLLALLGIPHELTRAWDG
ncbi:MAG: UbiX family flavin prenyltransferase [Acidobacteriota bacterium]|nr:UbiX family flavin prenyltransferase [Acidobacteriota bacterium]MDH3785607.1 UbiX family flavin prenyltransferase [Acidobacteriota bacterium]